MTSNYITYLTDTLNGVPVQNQAAARKVSGSSQSSVLKTAMKNLLQQKAVRSNKANYDVIAHDKKVQHLNRHRHFWQQALDDYLDSRQPQPQAQTIKRDNINDNSTNTKRRKPIETVFYAESIEDAFNVVSQSSLPLSAYDGALLMYNTIVKLHQIEYK